MVVLVDVDGMRNNNNDSFLVLIKRLLLVRLELRLVFISLSR